MTSRIRLLGPLGARLALAFLVVAVGALALLTGLVLVAAERDVTQLARQEQDHTMAAVASAAATAYARAGGWERVDLDPALALAADHQASLVVLDAAGRQVATSSGGSGRGPLHMKAVEAGGRPVGTVRVRFAAGGLTSAERRLRDALVGTVATGAGLATLLALAMAVVVSRHITRPLVALTRTVQAMEGGDRAARVGDVAAPGELGELARAFDRMAEALAEEDSLRRALVADVAHELRTPLAILQGTLEGMADGVVKTTPAKLSSLHDDVLRLGRIVEDLETLAAADAAGLSLDARPTDLAEVAGTTAMQMRPQFEAAGLHLEIDLAPAVVEGDADRLHQMVMNLLSNALKFTPAGGRVRLEVAGNGSTVRLEVADTGTGIPAADLPRVFDRFWRGAHTGAAGSGIGLTVVAELARVHRGTVDVESEPGQGTRVSVSLPRA